MIINNDTKIHLEACKIADDECFRLYGTDSIHDRFILWPRWLKIYSEACDKLYENAVQSAG